MKKLLIASILAVSLSGAAVAGTASQNNFGQVFASQGNNQTMQAELLSNQEMQATEGKIWATVIKWIVKNGKKIKTTILVNMADTGVSQPMTDSQKPKN
ncbi:hypothetical protein HMY34_01430 [Thiothrix subterranea]|uniref:hypothetical protein n=1 Tax=Thiothrix subterranea TaxID=2735563 RepID=UPI00192B342E|nr:hypothetical protein [Thiothrix subterranea]QQZ27524.1 hypothetical protein HMY34_01430 [Thiothrix subterranea]